MIKEYRSVETDVTIGIRVSLVVERRLFDAQAIAAEVFLDQFVIDCELMPTTICLRREINVA